MSHNTRKPAKKAAEQRPRGFYTWTEVSAAAIKIDQLPHLTFYGRDLELAKRAALSELARQAPQGYDLVEKPDPTRQ